MLPRARGDHFALVLGLWILIWGFGAHGETVGDKFDFEHFQFEDEAATQFSDRPLREPLVYPSWFKLSFLNLPDDLRDTVDAGKDGLIVYFGQRFCPYCKALLEKDLGRDDIVRYTRKHFEIVALDVHGDRVVTDMSGAETTEKQLAQRERTNFTPSLIFYDRDGREALRLRGYYPPYKFRAALEYVADGYYRGESFRHYLARAGVLSSAGGNILNRETFFASPPYVLDRTHRTAERPLAVFFEQGDCHACDILHAGPLSNAVIRGQLQNVDAVQLNMWADTPLVTPGGRRTTARDWAKDLGLFYAPTIIFFDERGEEILRVDSVVHFYRLRGVLDYILGGAYKRGLTFQQWRVGPHPGGHDAHQ